MKGSAGAQAVISTADTELGNGTVTSPGCTQPCSPKHPWSHAGSGGIKPHLVTMMMPPLCPPTPRGDPRSAVGEPKTTRCSPSSAHSSPAFLVM